MTFYAWHPNLVKNIKLKTQRLIMAVTLHNENHVNVYFRGLGAWPGWGVGGCTDVILSRDPQTGSPQAAGSPRDALFG